MQKTANLQSLEAFTFKPLSKTKLIQPGFIITNVVPGDYNYDGNLDVLLMGEENPNKNPTNAINMQIYLGNGNDTFGIDWKQWHTTMAVNNDSFYYRTGSH
jgi:integrin alpha FG-GAP repeat containing protein 1